MCVREARIRNTFVFQPENRPRTNPGRVRDDHDDPREAPPAREEPDEGGADRLGALVQCVRAMPYKPYAQGTGKAGINNWRVPQRAKVG